MDATADTPVNPLPPSSIPDLLPPSSVPDQPATSHSNPNILAPSPPAGPGKPPTVPDNEESAAPTKKRTPKGTGKRATRG